MGRKHVLIIFLSCNLTALLPCHANRIVSVMDIGMSCFPSMQLPFVSTSCKLCIVESYEKKKCCEEDQNVVLDNFFFWLARALVSLFLPVGD